MQRPPSPWSPARWARLRLAPVVALLALASPSLAEDPEEPSSWTSVPSEPASRPAPSGPSPPVSPAAAPAPVADPGGAPPPPFVDETVEDDDARALTEFRSRLDPYGTWVDDPTYGMIWVPDRRVVGERFAPYVSSGRWTTARDGSWVWVSDHPFGEVVFHYGRWVWTRYGWAWIPGYRYASAWVEWRGPSPSYAYYGWAPAPPSFVWVSGVAVMWTYPAPYYWVFCPSAYVFAPYPYGYIVTHPVHARLLARRTRHFVPAWPLPRPRARAEAQEAARPPARVPQVKAPQLTRVPYRRQEAATRWVESGQAGLPDRRPRPAPARAEPPEAKRRSPPPLRPARPSEPRRVVSPPPKGYSPPHGTAPVRRR